MIEWHPLPDKGKQDRLGEIIQSWKGTPWLSRQCCKGGGVDCINFVVAVLNEMRGRSYGPLETKNNAYHKANNGHWRETYRIIRESFGDSAPLHLTDPLVVFPGDVLLIESGRDTGHVIIVGTRKNTLHHALSGQGVTMIGTGNLYPVTGHWRDCWEHWT